MSTTGEKSGKRKSSLANNSASSKKRKHFHAKGSTNEVVTMDESDIDEHTRLLSSVTGKMERLPMQEDTHEDEGEDVEEGTKEPPASGEEREGTAGMDKEAAAQYLALWSTQRDKWTFRKKTQYWLLQNMYDKKMVMVTTYYALQLGGNMDRERVWTLIATLGECHD